MQKLFVYYGEPTDPAAFEKYYVENHLPLVQRLPGLISAEFSLGLRVLGEGNAPWGLFQAEFESAEALQAALESDAGTAVAGDVKNYATGGATVVTAPVTSV